MNTVYMQRFWVFVAFFLFSSSVMAANLTDSQVKNYIATINAFNQMEASDSDFDDWLDEDDFDISALEQGIPSIEAMIKKSPRDSSYKKAEAEVKKHGFASLQQWAQVADKVNAAMVVAMLAGEEANLHNEMQRMQAEIQGMEGLSAEQKEMMLSMATAGMNMMDNWTAGVPEADVKVVKRHLKELNQVMDND